MCASMKSYELLNVPKKKLCPYISQMSSTIYVDIVTENQVCSTPLLTLHSLKSLL